MNTNNTIVRLTAWFIMIVMNGCSSSVKAQETTTHPLETKTEALALLNRVNHYWQTHNPKHGNAFWHRAAYHTGNMAAYEVTGNEAYKAYSAEWAEQNEWKGAKSDDRDSWKYAYGETDDYVLFGDWQTCFQVYADLYQLDPADHKIARAIDVMEYQMGTPRNDYWWWADGLYMVMPVMTKLYQITGNRLYLEKLHDYFSHARELLYDEESALFYRDAKYIYPKHQTANGKKDFWARGNGWVFAALAKVLQDLPEDNPHRDEYVEMFQKMATALKTAQQEEGYWSRSLLDLQHAPGYETSGTAFFLYGYLWGINNGLLAEKDHLAVVERGWRYLTHTALQENGVVGYVQPIGERADQHHNVGPETTADFGVGAFLLAASEMVRYSTAKSSFTPGAIWRDDRGKHINAHGGGILFHEGRYYWFGEHKGERSNAALVGITCYSSDDLYNWKYEGVAFTVSDDRENPVVKGSTIERPKVIHNARTGKFVMYFHLELKDRGYEAAHVAVAVSDRITGPYALLKHGRVNAGVWPMNMTEAQRNSSLQPSHFNQWWTPEWMAAIKDGLLVRRDLAGGQMSRDMTLFLDEDGKAYHIYASEENLTLHIAELTDDYLDHTGNYVRVAPGGHNEAPAIFKKEGRYFMITSGCTGWEPNAARLLTANHILGPWTSHPNPARGKDAELTFHAQGTFILPVQGMKDAYIFMADRWRPDHPVDGRYIWLPVLFKDGMPLLKWHDNWDLTARLKQ